MEGVQLTRRLYNVGGMCSRHLRMITDSVASEECVCLAQVAPVGNEPPNRTLFVQNLPAATTSAMLQMLFQQFEGYVETRMVEARPGIAFVDFQTDGQATTALQGLQGFKITPTNALSISYQKR